MCRRFSKGRVFLAGDAAHVTPPFAGQGLVAGLRDAANLAWKLAWVVRGHAAPSILDTYDEERRPHAVKMIRLAKFMGQLVMPQSHARGAIVHGAMALLRRLSVFRRLFDELEIKPQNAFRKGLFVPGGARGLRGTWFPQGLLRSPSGSIEPSDDVLGSELVIVGLGVDPRAHFSEQTQELWSRAGGHIAHVAPRGARGTCYEDVEGRLVPGAAPWGWCVVVRPDRTVLHDGRVEDADRIVRESLELLDSVDSARSDLTPLRVLRTQRARKGERQWTRKS